MRKFTILLLFTAIFGGLNAQNLIRNGSFESWTNGLPNNWIGLRTTIDSSNILQSDIAAFGNFSVQLINTGSSQKRFTCDSLEVFEGESYQITFLIKGEGQIRTCLYDTTFGKYNDYVIATPNWEKHIQTVTANATSTSGEFIFSLKLTDDNGIYLDSVVIEKFFGAEIYSFVLAEEIRPAIIISNMAQVSSTVDWSTDLSKLEPIITVSTGATINPTLLPVVFDGINPVEYKVTAANGSTKLWNVYVSKASPPIEIPIHDIQFTESELGDSPHKGEWIETSGIVTGLNAEGFFLQNGTGAWNGLWVSSPEKADSVKLGDDLSLIGFIEEINNLTQITNIYKLNVNSSGNDWPEPTLVGIPDINESLEGVLSSIESVSCIVEADTDSVWEVGDESGNTLKIGGDLFSYIPILNEKYRSITGCITFSSNAFKILPRDTNDIEVIVIDIKQNQLSLVSFYPNPVKNELNIANTEKINQIILSNILGQRILVKEIKANTTSISTSELKPGVYIISFVSKNGDMRSERIIKE